MEKHPASQELLVDQDVQNEKDQQDQQDQQEKQDEQNGMEETCAKAVVPTLLGEALCSGEDGVGRCRHTGK